MRRIRFGIAAITVAVAVLLLTPGMRHAVAQAPTRLFGTTSTGAARPVAVDSAGNIGVSVAAGTSNIGDVDVLSIAAGDNNVGNVDVASIAAGSALIGRVQLDAQAANGADGLKYTSVGTTEDEHQVKATAGVLYSITATNTNAEERYLRCANLTAANTTPGTSTPIIDLAIPGPATGGGLHATFPMGLTFSTALTCWIVTGAADTDVAEVAANEAKILYTFK